MIVGICRGEKEIRIGARKGPREAAAEQVPYSWYRIANFMGLM